VSVDLPVFGARWDLDAAVRVQVRSDLHARPVLHPYTTVACARRGVSLSGMAYLPRDGGRYGRVAFLDVASGRRALVDSRATCDRLLPCFTPGPFVLPR
jgi:hypothetical protein